MDKHMTVSSVSERPRSSRRTREWAATIAAILVVGASVLAAAWVYRQGTEGSESTANASAPATANVPSVLSRGFVGLPLAAHDRDVLVGIGARPGGPVDVVVIPSDESEVAPDSVRIQVAESGSPFTGTQASPCGRRCLRFSLSVLAGAASLLEIDVERAGKDTARVRFDIPARLPPRADSLFERARFRMLGLRSLTMEETLGAGLSSPVVSRWSFQAPDRMRYAIAGGGRAVVIGGQRWDWLNGSWERSEISRLRAPAFSWQSAVQPRLLGRATVGRTRANVVVLWKPRADFPAWFQLYVTDDARVLRARMLTTAHFMDDTYGAFDAARPILPPA